MGNIYAGMSVGLGFILFCILLSVVWFAFRNFKKRMLPQKNSIEGTEFARYQENEKRDNKRHKIAWSVSLETAMGIIKAETKDLSRSGAFVKCRTPLMPGERFCLTIDIPAKDPISLKSIVVWSNGNIPEEKVVNRGMGVRFLQNLDEDLSSLKMALEEHIESINVSVQRPAFV